MNNLFFSDESIASAKKPEIVRPNVNDLRGNSFDNSCLKIEDHLQFYSDAELMESARRKDVLVYDVEVYPNYFLAGFKSIYTEKIAFVESEYDHQRKTDVINFKKLRWILENFKTIGFNSINFDNPVCVAAIASKGSAAYCQKITDLLIAKNSKLKDVYQSIKKVCKFREEIKLDHIDLFEIPMGAKDDVSAWGTEKGLKTYAARLFCKSLESLPIEAGLNLSDLEKSQVKWYCLSKDLDATLSLFKALKDDLALRANISKQYDMDVMSKSGPQIAEAVLKNEIRSITRQYFEKPDLLFRQELNIKYHPCLKFQDSQVQGFLEDFKRTSFLTNENGRPVLPEKLTKPFRFYGCDVALGIGGIHTKEENIYCESNDEWQIGILDVTSYYPSIIERLKLFPKSVGTAFLDSYVNMKRERVKFKKAGDKMKAESYKLFINGTFGKLMQPFSVLYDPAMGLSVTLNGQLCLLMLADMFYSVGIKTLSMNTDGIVFAYRRNHFSIMEETYRKWEELTGFSLEMSSWKSLLAISVNDYVAVTNEGSLKRKGSFVPQIDKGKLNISHNPRGQVMSDAICTMIKDRTPLEQSIESETDFRKFVFVKRITGGGNFVNIPAKSLKDRLAYLEMSGIVNPDIPLKESVILKNIDTWELNAYRSQGKYVGKVARWYYSRNSIGRIEYVKSCNKVPDSDNAMECMDLPDSMPNDVWKEKYVEKVKTLLADIKKVNFE